MVLSLRQRCVFPACVAGACRQRRVAVIILVEDKDRPAGRFCDGTADVLHTGLHREAPVGIKKLSYRKQIVR